LLLLLFCQVVFLCSENQLCDAVEHLERKHGKVTSNLVGHLPRPSFLFPRVNCFVHLSSKPLFSLRQAHYVAQAASNHDPPVSASQVTGVHHHAWPSKLFLGGGGELFYLKVKKEQ
jgi:hypothetical protein